MNETGKLILCIVVVLCLIAVFVFVMPSLIGLLMGVILVFAFFDLAARRYRIAVRTFNSAVRALSHHDGAVGKVAVAFSRSGPLSGPCYEYARRLMIGENPIDAAAMSGVPLQLSTAVALEARPGADRAERTDDFREFELLIRDSGSMPAYGQLVYLTMTACVTCFVLTYLGAFIVPKIERVFEEFGVGGQYKTLLSGTPAIWILVTVGVVVLVMIPILRRGHLFGVRLHPWLPMMPSSAERKAETLRGLADAIDAGWPMGRALAIGHAISMRRDERRSLEAAMQLIGQGLAPAVAIHRAGWISNDEQSWFTDASPRRTAELLRVIAEQSVRDARSDLRWAISIFFPVGILMLGVAVLTYAYGFFGGLMELVRELP